MNRPDGKRIKNADPMYQVAAFVMDKRVDSMNMITVDLPLDPMNAYIHKVRNERGIALSPMGLLLAGYLRTSCDFPALNRFVVNKRIYTRTEFCAGLVVLKAGGEEGTMSKIYFDQRDTVFDVQRKIDEYIEKNRNAENNNSTDKLIKTLLSIPGLCSFGVWMFKFLDRHGLLPKKIIDASPFHESLLISNLASIRTNHIYHHVYEFGTTSVGITMGNPRVVPRLSRDEVVFERTLPLGVVMDERICSGSYFAAAFKKLTSYLKNPALLENPPEQIKHDVT